MRNSSIFFFAFFFTQCKHIETTLPGCRFETVSLYDLSTSYQRVLDPTNIYDKILVYAPGEMGFLNLDQNQKISFDPATKQPPKESWEIERSNQKQFKIKSKDGYLVWKNNRFEWSKDPSYPKEKFQAIYFFDPKDPTMVKIKSEKGFFLSYQNKNDETVLSSDGQDLFLVWIVDMWNVMTAFSEKETGGHITFEEQNRFKKHTLGYLSKGSPSESSWGIKFHTEFWHDGSFWLYEGFPKGENEKVDGKPFQIVWNGLKKEGDLILADSTVPRDADIVIWDPGIPRAYAERQAIGYKMPTREVSFTTKNRNPVNGEYLPKTGKGKECGMVYSPYEIDLTQGKAKTKETYKEESMGSRWVIDIGLSGQSERWSFDLGPEVGIFKPRFGLVGYHSHIGFNDTRYLGRIQTIDKSKKEDREKFFHTPGDGLWAPDFHKK